MLDPIEVFCGKVCAHVRFHPDHAAITAELTAHLKDHAAEFSGQYSYWAAREKAVEAMGDPAELGRWLDKVHSPLLGWFQIWFRRVVYTVVVLILVALPFLAELFCSGFTPAPLRNDPWTSRSFPHVLSDFDPDVKWKTENYTFDVARTVVFDDGDTLSLCHAVAVTHRDPWLREPDLDDGLWAKDDLGNRYPAQRGPDFRLHDYFQSWYNRSPFVTYLYFRVSGIDPAAQSVTIVFDRYYILRDGDWYAWCVINRQGPFWNEFSELRAVKNDSSQPAIALQLPTMTLDAAILVIINDPAVAEVELCSNWNLGMRSITRQSFSGQPGQYLLITGLDPDHHSISPVLRLYDANGQSLTEDIIPHNYW